MFENFRRMVRHVFTEDKDGNEIGSSKSVYAKNGFIASNIIAKSSEKNTKGKTGTG